MQKFLKSGNWSFSITALKHILLMYIYRYINIFLYFCSHISINIMKKIESFNLRSFTSFSLVISTIIMSWSGFILYVAPPGRIANWGSWKLMLFTKAEWQAMHTIFSYLFFILAIIHLFFVNWKTFLNYLKSKLKAGLNKKWELIAASLLSVYIFIGSIYSWTPFGPVMTFGEKIKGSWEQNYKGAPVAHMEEYTIMKLSSDFSITPEELIKTLVDNNIKVRNIDLTLKTVASENKTIPSKIYEMLTSKYGKSIQGSGNEPPAGIGKFTVKATAENTGKELSVLIGILKENGIDAKGETTLREIAEKLGITPRDVYNLLLGK
jgi:hypothetical protein